MGNKQDLNASKQTLKDKLMAIILLETSKDYKEMDSDLVTECVDFLMELEGKQKLTKAEIEQRVNEIPFKGKVTAISSYTKKKIRAKRLAVIAAVLAFIIALFGIIAVAVGSSPVELLKKLGYSVIEMFSGETIEYENITLTKPNESKTYSSIKELVNDEKIEILYPTWLPQNEKIVSVWYVITEQSEEYILQSENSKYSINVKVNGVITDGMKEDCSLKEIDEYEIYYSDEDIFIQGNFKYKNNLYIVKSDTEENLFKIIDNLEEIK